MIVTNAFSLNMLPGWRRDPAVTTELRVQPVSVEQAQELARRGFVSAVGHADTATIFSVILGVKVPVNRATVTLDAEPLLVGQYIGPRLPEGVTTLPEGAKVEFFLVSVI